MSQFYLLIFEGSKETDDELFKESVSGNFYNASIFDWLDLEVVSVTKGTAFVMLFTVLKIRWLFLLLLQLGRLGDSYCD